MPFTLLATFSSSVHRNGDYVRFAASTFRFSGGALTFVPWHLMHGRPL